jgi:aminopeptidase N
MEISFDCWAPYGPLYCNESDSIVVLANGKHISSQRIIESGVSGEKHLDTLLFAKTHGYKVTNPINTYNATFYLGDYISWTDTLMGEKGKLDLSFYVLRYNEERARKHFAVTKQMLHCFEHWMGPYPFYEDGYKLVEAPYLGMEHQSAVAYGNKYQMGYMGADRSKTGVGLLFDFIIVHESGHEWFGNNITAQDVADNWLHEGFTTYTEALFAECAFGKEKAFAYTTGQWHGIDNDVPVIGPYGVHKEGSGDIYDKGSAVVHMVRMIMNDDEKFRQLLRGLNKDFYHKIVTSAQVEDYIGKFAGYNFTPLFNQYLRTTKIPKLEWYIKKKELYYRFSDVVEGFTLPIPITSGRDKAVLTPTAEWQHLKWKKGFDVEFDKNFLIKID